MPQDPCPSPDDLFAFHVGRLTEPWLNAIGNHLEECPDCQSHLQTLDGLSDPVLSALRWSGPQAEVASTPESRTATEKVPADDERLSELLAPPQAADELGRLGPYRILRLLGRGGMGVVFEAEDTRLGRGVALKVLQPGQAAAAEARQRFLREARALATLRDTAHLVTIYDVGEERGLPFLTMELLAGTPLDRWLAGHRPAPLAEVLRIGREIALGLAAAHAQGLIHRDIKPANIWLEEKPGQIPEGSGHVKLLDFGLARPLQEEMRLTSPSVVAGTPAYLSPEQAQGEPLDARTDLFSLGCVLYELCTGRRPFEGRTAVALMMALTLKAPPRIRTLNPEVPPALEALVLQLLAKKPADRPASAAEVAQRLQTLALEPAGRRRRPRWRVWVLAGLLGVAGLLAGVTLLRIQTSQGVVEIESDDPKIEVTVLQNGEQVTILDPESRQRVELRAGVYEVRLGDGTPGLQLETDHFTLRRGEKKVLTVRRVSPPAAVAPPVQDPWLQRVSGLGPEEQVQAVAERLKELNPGFSGETSHQTENGVVTTLFFRTDQVTDISPVRALTGLRTLVCSGATPQAQRFKDLSPLHGMQLTTLDCGFSAVADLSPLQGLPLHDLSCQNTALTDLKGIQGLPLTSLYCGGNAIRDLTPLRGMKLKALRCDYTWVTDLSPLADMPLTSLQLDGSHVADLSPLRGLPLVYLRCERTRVKDLSPLQGCPLRAFRGDIGSEGNAEVLRSIKTLETINQEPAAEFWRENGKPQP